MKYAVNMQNMSFAADGGLTRCNADEAFQCFMSPHMQSAIETPFFMFNSRFDEWQLLNELQTGATRQHMAANKEIASGILQYGRDFLSQQAAVGGAGSKNGGFITTCICHGCPWADLVLDNRTATQHYADWFHGKATGAAAMHRDVRGPNGDGTIVNKRCDVWAPPQ